MVSDRAGQLKHRLGQGLHALHPWRGAPATPHVLADPRLLRLFESLSARDRRHLVAAWRTAQLRTHDRDLLLAVLLHDIGKATLSGERISLAARVIAVLTAAAPISIRARFRTEPKGSWLTGLWLAEHHARIGAERLRALGMLKEVCRLVELHDSPEITDDRLKLLRQIDSATL